MRFPRSFAILLFALAIRCSLFAIPDSVLFTESGTFTVPDGVTMVTIEAIGAGGNGGPNGGGGGGGGGYASGTYTVVAGTDLNVTVGRSGGYTSKVEGYLSATGGVNGSVVGGGTGGVGTGGTVKNTTGGTGGFGVEAKSGGGGGGCAGSIGYGQHGYGALDELCVNVGGNGGTGGGPYAGSGGNGGGYDHFLCDPPQQAKSGTTYGGGGGGAGNIGSPGHGSPGSVKFTWDIPSSVFEEATLINEWQSGSSDISIYDITGCKVNVSSTNNLPPTSYNLSPGTYFLVSIQGARIRTARLNRF